MPLTKQLNLNLARVILGLFTLEWVMTLTLVLSGVHVPLEEHLLLFPWAWANALLWGLYVLGLLLAFNTLWRHHSRLGRQER